MGNGGEGPAPGWRRKRDGFTAAKRQAFVAALATHGTIADACRIAGVSTTTFYRHEKRDADLASLCRAARAQAAGNLETLAWERGVTGIEEPVVQGGKVVATRRRRSDAIFRLILQASNPKKYGRMAAARRKEVEKEVRKRIEREVRAEIAGRLYATREETDAMILKRLSILHRRICADPACAQCGREAAADAAGAEAPGADPGDAAGAERGRAESGSGA